MERAIESLKNAHDTLIRKNNKNKREKNLSEDEGDEDRVEHIR